MNNEFSIRDGTVYMRLSYNPRNGKRVPCLATFDEEDLPTVSDVPYQWYASLIPHRNAAFYAVATKPGGRGEPIFLHRLLIGDREGFVPDHINGNPLDNRRINLRWLTRSENARNHCPEVCNA